MCLGVVPLVMPKSEDTEDGPTVQKLPKSNTKKSMASGTKKSLCSLGCTCSLRCLCSLGRPCSLRCTHSLGSQVEHCPCPLWDGPVLGSELRDLALSHTETDLSCQERGSVWLRQRKIWQEKLLKRILFKKLEI